MAAQGFYLAPPVLLQYLSCIISLHISLRTWGFSNCGDIYVYSGALWFVSPYYGIMCLGMVMKSIVKKRKGVLET